MSSKGVKSKARSISGLWGIFWSQYVFQGLIPIFFKKIQKYVGHLTRTLKKIPPTDLTQGGGAMQSLEK